MDKGMRVIICIIAITLVMIAERGVPVKLSNWNMVAYGILYCVFITIAELMI